MKCVNDCGNEAVGGFYCDECTPTPEATEKALREMTERFGPVVRCSKCQEEFRTKGKERRCVGCRTFG